MKSPSNNGCNSLGIYHDYLQKKMHVREELNRSHSDTCVEMMHHMTERDVHANYEHPEDTEPNYSYALKKALSMHDLSWHPRNFFNFAEQIFPIINEIKSYKKSYILGDIAAGIAVGLASIPIGMSYADMARVPVQHGLYLQFLCGVIYMFFGSGRVIAIGANGVESLMSSFIVASIVGWNASEEVWLNASIGLAFFVGIDLLIMRIFKLGFIANFLADSVVSGFSTGCAVIIAISQLQNFLGFNVERGTTIDILKYVYTHIEETHWISIVMCMSGVLLIYIVTLLNRYVFKPVFVPTSLVIMVVFISVTYGFKLYDHPFNVPIVGYIPKGLPKPLVFNFNPSIVKSLLVNSFFFSIVYFLMHSGLCKSVARKKRFQLNYNQELLATSMCNIIGSFLQCYPVGSSIARTSIALQTNVNTQLYNQFVFLTLLIALNFMTHLFYYLPKAGLSSIVLYGVCSMMDFCEVFRLAKFASIDLTLWLISFFTTVFIGATEGIIISVGLSLLWVVKIAAFPENEVIGRLPGSNIYRNIKTFQNAKENPGIKIFHFSAPLYFCNIEYFKKKIFEIAEISPQLIQKKKEDLQTSNVKVIIVDASAISGVDVTSVRLLKVIKTTLELHGITLLFSNWRGPTKSYLYKIKFYHVIPPDRCFLTIQDAVAWASSFYLSTKHNVLNVTL